MNNHRNLSRRTYLKAAGVAGISAVAGCLGGGNNKTNWVMGTSQQGSTGFAVGTAIQDVVRNHSDRISISAQTSPGLAANLRGLESEFDLGVCSAKVHYDAIQGEGTFKDNPVSNPGEVGFSYASAECFMVTQADSDIETYSDLAGRTITTYAKGSGLYAVTDPIVERLGIKNDYEFRNIGLNELGSAMDNERIEACGTYTILGGDHVSGGTKQLFNQADLKPVRFSESEREQVSGVPSVPITTVSPEPLESIDNVTAWQDVTNVIFSSDLDSDAVQHVMNVLLENWDEVQAATNVLENTDSAITSGILPELPIHPGAKAYYENRGISPGESKTATATTTR